MILKSERVAELLNAEDQSDPLIITPQPDLERLKSSGAASIDLRLGSWFAAMRRSRASHLKLVGEVEGADARFLSKMHFVRFGDTFVLHPQQFILGVTLEWIRLPKDYAGYVTSRSSWGRRGLVIATAVGVHPGFSECLTLELINLGELPVKLSPGLAICQLFIHQVSYGSDTVDRSIFIGERKPVLGEIGLDEFAEKLRHPV
jgi:dCTP deaminase